jgi:hypothetical protein
MARPLEKILHSFPRPYLTDNELAIILDGSANSRYSKVKRLVAQGMLLRIRRGLYAIPNSLSMKQPNPFELAQYIDGPSYISFESALSYHQLIPETVYTVTSATAKRSKTYQTPLGLFSYRHLPLKNLYIQVERIEENGYYFFIAKPWKALCDYIFCSPQQFSDLSSLLDSLRIDKDDLPRLTHEDIELLNEYYHHNRVSCFLKTIQKASLT